MVKRGKQSSAESDFETDEELEALDQLVDELESEFSVEDDTSEGQDIIPGAAAGVPDEVLRMWRSYHESDRSDEERNRLIEHYLPLVCQHAQRLATRLPPSVEVDDLVSAGTLGLIDAIKKFDPSMGTKFETYCGRRLTGAMLDELRRYDWVPRLIRNRAHQLDRARDELETRLKRKATPEELAKHMNMSNDQYDALLRELSVKTIFSLDRKWDDDDNNEMRHVEVLTDVRQKSPLEELQRDEIRNLAIRGLSQKEKMILQMYYYDHLSLKEIGAVLEISESRVCQIHQQTLTLLREKFKSREVHTFD
ncbi:MAG: sigma-70 family RNA polymerase sigma factor [Planctomycetota bacterium]|jgi:RNA polymerase sigma factor for flagellar operon FliA